jgi:hypothetical protein
MRTLVIFLLVLILNNSGLEAQDEQCIKDFNFLVEKVKADYPGFKDKVNPENLGRLKDLENALRVKINRSPDSCIYYLRQYTSWFKDNHLRVGRVFQEQKQLIKSEFSSFGKNLDINFQEYSQRTQHSKTIEGIWTSGRGDMAIIKSNESDNFLGVVINYHGWKPEQVMFEFTAKSDSLFVLKEHSNYLDSKPHYGTASLHLKNNILEIHNNTCFVRKSDSKQYDLAILKTYVPEFPNGQNTFFTALCLSDSTFYIRIPGFDGFKDQIEETISKHWNDIMSRPNMIIDIRYNGGGQDDEFQILLKLLYTKAYEEKGVEWYATLDNIKILEEILAKGESRNGEEGIKWTKALVSEMKKNIGGFVVHPFDKENINTPPSMDTIYKNPNRIGIIINDENASSAEQFLLEAKWSKKVILFGNQSTAGVLDYSNAIPINFPSGKYKLTFPMTRSQRLPENPIDNIGIKPDINIPFTPAKQLFDKLDSWVDFVKNYLESAGL